MLLIQFQYSRSNGTVHIAIQHLDHQMLTEVNYTTFKASKTLNSKALETIPTIPKP